MKIIYCPRLNNMWKKIKRNKITFLYEQFLSFSQRRSRKKDNNSTTNSTPVISSSVSSTISRIFHDSKSKLYHIVCNLKILTLPWNCRDSSIRLIQSVNAILVQLVLDRTCDLRTFENSDYKFRVKDGTKLRKHIRKINERRHSWHPFILSTSANLIFRSLLRKVHVSRPFW